jgi:Uma2 family endonuclease
MAQVGIATPTGVRAPDVAWCSDGRLSAHPEEMPLSAAPELCVVVASASDALPKLRQEAMAYVSAGAIEAWIVFPQSRQIEVHAREGRKATTSYPLDLATLLA